MKNQKFAAVLLAGLIAASGTVFVPAPENPLMTSVSAASSSKLDAPKNFKAKTVTEDSVTLSWSKVSGASAYRVYMYDSETDEYESVKTVTETSYTVKKLSAGKTYRFKIAALTGKEGEYKVQTKSSVLKVKTEEEEKLDAPENITSTSAANSITLRWDDVTGADAYRVYMYNEKTGEYEKYKTLAFSNVSCSVTGLKSGTKYKFKIAALVKVNGKYVEQKKTGGLTVSTKIDIDDGSRVVPGEWDLPSGGSSSKKVLSECGIGEYEKSKDSNGDMKYIGKTYYAGIYSSVILTFNKKDQFKGAYISTPMTYTQYSAYLSLCKNEFGYDYNYSDGTYFWGIGTSFVLGVGYNSSTDAMYNYIHYTKYDI